LQIIVSGAHLSKRAGYTYREIEQDGFRIDEKVDMHLASDYPKDIVKAMASAMEGLSHAYESLKPDVIVVLGDRYELLSVASSALVCGIPLAHISGGDVTEGVIDDSIRHAVTKMSHLHFVGTQESRARVIQLGEDPQKVFNVGELSLDNIRNLKLLSKDQLKKELKFNLKKHNLLVTFHPVTIERGTSGKYFMELLKAMDTLDETSIIFTKANADTGGVEINRIIDEYVAGHKGKAVSFSSMGRLKYLSAMKYSDAVVGNSSSGIVEAPSFRIGTINIGDRQKGRLNAESVIDCTPSSKDITKAFKKLYSKEFCSKLKTVKSPFGDGRSAERIRRIIKSQDLKEILKKKFHDLKGTV
jgi:GDP/UDP-N,N'-diacetylbacillosamine 2-epimerase (hydrolysing)